MSEDESKRRLGRRVLALRIAAGSAVVAGVAAVRPAVAQVTDNDPSDGPGQGRGPTRPGSGITDNDPSDGPGAGRGPVRGAAVTDNDPTDGPGRGRGPSRPGSGVTDNDPSDGPGAGRGPARR